MNENSPIVVHEALKATVTAWFELLRDRICAAFIATEDYPGAPYANRPAGRFQRTTWSRFTKTARTVAPVRSAS